MSDQESDATPHPTDSENSENEQDDLISDNSDCSITDDELDDNDELGIDGEKQESAQEGGAPVGSKKNLVISEQSLPIPLVNNPIPLPSLTDDNDDLDADTEEDEEEDDDEDIDNLAKFDEETRKNHLLAHHPQAIMPSFEEVRALTTVTRDNNGNPVDPLHRTVPILTKYERTRVIGVRASQLSNGAPPYIKLETPVINELIIAAMELEAGKLPFVIRRPLPSGGSEYWKLSDLAII
jgi:DNA-directed RNA polymerase subunit K/omega